MINLIKKILFKIIGRYNELYFLGCTDKLPEPLSKEEELFYLALSEDGDKHAKDILIEHNLRLVVFLAKKYENTKVDLEDLVSLSYDAEGNELRLEDILGTDPDIVTKGLEEDDNKKIMMGEIEKLNVRDREIMVLRYGLCGHKEKTQKEVADLLGISQSYISRIEKKVIKRLKNIVKV